MKKKVYKKYNTYSLNYGKYKKPILAHILFIIFHSCCALVSIALVLIIFRCVSERQVDDVNPFIQCNSDLIKESQSLMVIPFYKGVSIAENETFCSYLLSLNKTLGMHGVYHYYDEFNETQDEAYIQKGMTAFKKCFGFYPKIFEAPQLELNKENEILLKKMGFEIRSYPYQMTHKVYHCSDTGLYSNRIVNWL